MTDGWELPFFGLVVVAILIYRSGSDSVAPSSASFDVSLHGLYSDHKGLFEISVVAIEFEEPGLVFYVNGKYGCSKEPVLVDHVQVVAFMSGVEEEFHSFDPAPDGEATAQRMGNLVNFTAPVMLGNCGRGMFRAPVVNHDREERLAGVIARLDTAAVNMVEKFDREFGQYSVEGEELLNLEKEFMNDFVVREIMADINREFILEPGQLDMRVRFMDEDENRIEEAPFTIRMKQEEVDTLRGNMDAMVKNALRMELELKTLPYVSLVLER